MFTPVCGLALAAITRCTNREIILYPKERVFRDETMTIAFCSGSALLPRGGIVIFSGASARLRGHIGFVGYAVREDGLA